MLGNAECRLNGIVELLALTSVTSSRIESIPTTGVTEKIEKNGNDYYTTKPPHLLSYRTGHIDVGTSPRRCLVGFSNLR